MNPTKRRLRSNDDEDPNPQQPATRLRTSSSNQRDETESEGCSPSHSSPMMICPESSSLSLKSELVVDNVIAVQRFVYIT